MSSEAAQGIVILGMPRSGTTLLRRLLDAHPAICCPPETNVLSAAARFLREETFAGGVAVGVLSGLSFAGIAEQVVVARLREFVFGLLQDICRQSRKKRWVEKTALNIFHLDQIELLCSGSCRFLCLVRHPLDVVCSLKELTDKMEMYVAELHAYIRQHPAPLEAFAHAWVERQARLRRFVSDHDLRTCRRSSRKPCTRQRRLAWVTGKRTSVEPYTPKAWGAGDTCRRLLYIGSCILLQQRWSWLAIRPLPRPYRLSQKSLAVNTNWDCW